MVAFLKFSVVGGTCVSVYQYVAQTVFFSPMFIDDLHSHLFRSNRC